MNKVLISTLLAVTAVCQIASAGGSLPSDSMNQRIGAYIDTNIGTNFLYLATSEGGGADVEGFGWTASAGYLFQPYFGVEAGYMQNFSSHGSNHIDIPYVTTRFQIAMGERFNFITKVGAMYASIKGHGIGLPYIGVGGSYAINDNLDVNAQYQGAVYGVGGAGLLGLGLTYHF